MHDQAEIRLREGPMTLRTIPSSNKEHEARRAVLYARVSSKEQEREGLSIPAQLKLLSAGRGDLGADHGEAQPSNRRAVPGESAGVGA